MRTDGGDDELDLVARFEAANREPCVRGARTVAWIVLLVGAPFYLVDLARFPDVIVPLGWLRVVGMVMPLTLLLVLATERGRQIPRALTVLFSVLGTVLTTTQMDLTGGHASPYYAGLGLGMLLPALIMPWGAAWTWLNCAVIVATYFVAAYALGFPPDAEAIGNNLFSYLATTLIAGIATASRERVSWREFRVRLELEASRARLHEEVETSRALAAAGREMLGLLDTPQVLDRLCELATRLLGCEESHTVLHCPDGAWRTVAQHGDSPEEWALLRSVEATREEVAPLVDALSRDGFVQFDVRTVAGSSAAFAAAARTGITTAILVPLHAGLEMIGVQTAGYRGREEPFGESQQKLAIGLAQLASMALTNARLHEELARQGAAEHEARALAETASRAKDEFLATLSHELRTPLNVILGYLDMLDDGGLAGEERDRMLRRIRQVSRQLYFMITDTLEISRLYGGQLLPQIESLELDELWRELRSECEDLPRDAQVELRWSEALPAADLSTDRRMLLVVLRNLVGNALKFTARGTVTLSATVAADHVRLAVTDTGIGIPAEARERIFRMFEQIDASDRRRFGGVGLGLYIVQRFCTQIGAQVTLESEVGRGSCFTVCVPRARRPGRGEGDRDVLQSGDDGDL